MTIQKVNPLASIPTNSLPKLYIQHPYLFVHGVGTLIHFIDFNSYNETTGKCCSHHDFTDLLVLTQAPSVVLKFADE